MDWQEHYTTRLVEPDKAVSTVASGMSVMTSLAMATPDTLVRALAERAARDKLHLRIGNMMPLSSAPFLDPEYKDFFTYRSIYAGPLTRKAFAAGEAEFVPCHFHMHPRLFEADGSWPVDVAIASTSLPDEQGRLSLGVSVDYTLRACQQAKIVLAEVNPNMPQTGGDSYINVTDVDFFTLAPRPLTEVPTPHIGPVERAIGDHIAPFIKDGDCLQLGIGAIPDAVLSALDEKNDLGIHSEMISDGAMRLVRKGVINGRRKNLHPEKIVIAFAMGSTELYNWMHRNPAIEMHPVDYTNDPLVIGRNDKLISINSAISVDLLGQVASDMMGVRQFSGTGGQLDFVRGAALSKGGKSFIALPSTAGAHSRICATLEPGQAVTTPRTDVEYIVTEYGVARLRGLSNRERSEALINLAAPQFRDELRCRRKQVYGW